MSKFITVYQCNSEYGNNGIGKCCHRHGELVICESYVYALVYVCELALALEKEKWVVNINTN